MKLNQATAYALHALMYMVRHITQLPVTAGVIAKAEGIPPGYLAKIFSRLAKARFVTAVKGRNKGYVFARSPEKISLLDLFEVIEQGPLFDECLLKHCECGGTRESCGIYASWIAATKDIKELFARTSLASAAWGHPEHRFYSLPASLKGSRGTAGKKHYTSGNV